MTESVWLLALLQTSVTVISMEFMKTVLEPEQESSICGATVCMAARKLSYDKD